MIQMQKPSNAVLQAVPMLDFSREYALLRKEVLNAIESVCASQRFINGPEVARFEAAAAAACHVQFGVGCSSGTDALWLALAALEIGPGDAVVTTPFSFFATVSSILRAGAVPVLADIDERTFNLAPETVSKALAKPPVAHAMPGLSAFKKFAAIMPVHLYGQCANMDDFASLSAQHGLRVIEDAAQAFGACWNGISAGALGDAAAFSFYPTKNLSAFGDAGLLTTSSAKVEERARMLRTHGMRVRYFHDEVGWNSRLDTLQAAVLEVKLRRVANGNRRRRELAKLYDRLFRDADLVGATTADGIVLPFTDAQAQHVFHQYVIRAPRRDELRKFLTANKIGTEVYYPMPLHLQESLLPLGYKMGDFPVAERVAGEVLALPMYPELREDEAETVVEGIRRFMNDAEIRDKR